MGRFGDILWMIIGIIILIIVLTVDEIRFRFGVIGYIGAFALIGYGIKAIIDSKKDTNVLKMDILNTSVVENFYQNTKQAWMDDRLKNLGAAFKIEAKSSSLKQLKKTYLPYEGSALHTFFSRFHPQPDEFLISLSLGTHNTDNAWYVLTNKRLVQKDGETNEFREFYFQDIREYEINRAKAELNLKTRTGEQITLRKISYFPKKKYVDFLISQ